MLTMKIKGGAGKKDIYQTTMVDSIFLSHLLVNPGVRNRLERLFSKQFPRSRRGFSVMVTMFLYSSTRQQREHLARCNL